jgi:soluble lytic murein transglycosylase-like protein
MATWSQQQKDGVGRGNGWTTFTEQEQDMETGAFVPTFYAQRDGITYRQIGDKFVDAGSQRQPAQFESIDVQREAEQKLFGGEVNAQQFKDVFGYVPASYVTGQVAQGSDLGRAMREAGINFNRGGGGGGQSTSQITPLSGEIDAIVDQSAAQFGVPKDLILSVMDVESGGESDRATATSTAGARGHMQLMPATFEEMGGTDITAPGQNIPAGVAYLAQMMERYGGNVAHALAAYNAGPTKTDAAIKSGADWISKLPSETRAYLPKALGRYYTLTQQGGDKPVTSGGALQEGAANAADPVVAPETAQTEDPITESEPTRVTTEQAEGATHKGELSDEDAAEIARLISMMETQLGQAASLPKDQISDPLGAFKETGQLVLDALKVEHPSIPPEKMREMTGAE